MANHCRDCIHYDSEYNFIRESIIEWCDLDRRLEPCEEFVPIWGDREGLVDYYNNEDFDDGQ